VDGFVDKPCIVWVLIEFIFVFQSVTSGQFTALSAGRVP
jgi:hypothetical protein